MNLYGGLPYREEGNRPKIENLNELRGNYDICTVPDGVLYITAACDVQRGSEKYQQMSEEELDIEIKKARKEGRRENFPRLEIEFCGHGIGYRTWSIDYKRMEGHVYDIDGGAWEKLTRYYFEVLRGNSKQREELKEPVYVRKEDGREFPIQVTFIDAHDGEMTDIVYAYCQRISNFYPSMGFQDLKQRKKELGDERTKDNARRYRVNKVSNDLFMVSISTNFYKTRMFRSFTLVRNNIRGIPPGFMDHPKQYSDYYFKMLTAEEKRKDGSFYAGKRRNESSDCKVYNLCAGDFYLDSVVKDLRDLQIRRGVNRKLVESEITHSIVLSEMENSTKLKLFDK
jgi:phage terminase large subunit GpA-like protein